MTPQTKDYPLQLVTVNTPTRAHKDLLNSLGLDLTEHAGHDYIEVVLHFASATPTWRMTAGVYDQIDGTVPPG